MIIQEYERIGAASEDLSKEVSKLKATIAFLPYAARQEENGLGKSSNTSFRPARFSSPFLLFLVAQFLEVVLPISLKYAVLDAFRHQRWFLYHTSDIGTMMQLWTTAIFVLPRTTSVSRGVVDTLLRMAYDDELRPHIPVVAWDWLKERPILDDECWGLRLEIKHPVIQAVRELRDPELITSYLAIVWSERTDFDDRICRVMFGLIVEELSGIGAIGYRADLIKRLDDVLSQLNSEYAVDFWRKRRYGELMQALLVVDAQTMKILTGTSRRAIALFCLLAYMWTSRMSLYLLVCASTSVPVVVYGPLAPPHSNLWANSSEFLDFPSLLFSWTILSRNLCTTGGIPSVT